MFWTLNFSLTFSYLCVTPACLVVVGCLCPNPQAKITFYNIYLESLLHADLTILKLCSSSQLMTWFFSYLRHSAYCFLCLGLKIHIYCTRQQTQQFFFFFCPLGVSSTPSLALISRYSFSTPPSMAYYFVPVRLQKANSSHQCLFLDLESSRACGIFFLLFIHGDLSYVWVWQASLVFSLKVYIYYWLVLVLVGNMNLL